EWVERAALREHEKHDHHEDHEHHRHHPPELPLPEECEDLPGDVEPLSRALQGLHNSASFWAQAFQTIQSFRTRRSIPERENVLRASAGVATIGSPFKLKEVFSTTGTPVSWPNASIRRWYVGLSPRSTARNRALQPTCAIPGR